ncbi:MAG: DUF2934 domain-containing protein [Rubrivivax sp.]|nr:DUF2934 domain-containing protein [Rubrivivax sp.]
MKHNPSPSPSHATRGAAPKTRTPVPRPEADATRLDKTGDRVGERIRFAAYVLYEQRGYVAGHELEDWLRAEAQILLAEDDGTTSAK